MRSKQPTPSTQKESIRRSIGQWVRRGYQNLVSSSGASASDLEIGYPQRSLHLLLVLIAGAATTILIYLVHFYQHRQPALLVEPLAMAIAILFALASRSAIRRGRQVFGAYLAIIGVAIAFVANEFALAGVTLLVLAGGLAVIYITAVLMLPRRRGLLLPILLAYVGLLLVAGVHSPVARLDLSLYPFLGVFVPGITYSLFLLALILLVYHYRPTTIRARIIASLIFVALLPVAVTGTVAAQRSTESQQDGVFDRLESISVLKEAEITTWIETLDTTLTSQFSTDDRTLISSSLFNPLAEPEMVRTVVAQLDRQLVETMAYTQLFDEIFIMGRDGRVIYSTDSRQIGKSYAGQALVELGLKEHYISIPVYSPAIGSYRVISVQPFVDSTGYTRGILAGRARMDHLNEILLERAGLGETGETYLVGANQVLITRLHSGRQNLDVETEGVHRALEVRSNGSGNYTNALGSEVFGVYRWLPSLQVVLLAEQNREEAMGPVTYSIGINALIISIALLGSIALAILITGTITRAINDLVQVSTQIAAGNLELRAENLRRDELGVLGRSLNSMASQLGELVYALERRVAERTAELERRSEQLRAAAEVARDVTTNTELNTMLSSAAETIRERFSFYHTGIFLVDDAGEYAVLRAASGPSARKMLEQGHRLRVGAVGIVGTATGSGRAHIALDVGSDGSHYKNPFLPDTRSEMALPLVVNGRMIGALDVQSTQPDAFDQQDVTVLQTLADQLAVAIENARLIQRSNETVHELEQAYGRITQEAWDRYISTLGQSVGYRYQQMGVETMSEPNLEARQALLTGEAVKIAIESASDDIPGAEVTTLAARSGLAVPIRLRGQVIGVLNLRYEGGKVTQEMSTLAEEAAGRLALILDNSRLLQEARRQALREAQINTLATEMRSSVDIETILQTTARLLGKSLGASRTFIQLGVLPAANGSHEEKDS